MDCPACDGTLSHLHVSEVEVDVCKGGCGGIWFDQNELKKFDEPHEGAGAELLNIDVDPGIKVDHEQKRNCAKCHGVTMMRNFFSVKKEVEIDTCANCAGVWLDAGELNAIRKQFSSEKERKEAARAVFDELFDPELSKLKAESDEKLQSYRRFANMLRFICPSYYIPGKQDGAAF